jgi:polysaccharide biosynthesis transport protein
MELRSYLQILWRRLWIVLLTAVAATSVTILGTQSIEAKYRATATLRIGYSANTAIDYGMLEYMIRLKNTYAELARSGPVLATIEQAGIDRSVAELRENVNLEFPSNNEILELVVIDTEPAIAAQVANAIAEILINQNRLSRTGRLLTLTVVEPATIPSDAIQPTRATLIAIGGGIGLMSGLGLALLVENFDTTLFTLKQIEASTKLPTLGKIPRIRRGRRQELLNGTTPEGEAFRLLRTNYFAVKRNNPAQSVLVTSAEPNAGKSTITTNLGYSVAQLGRKVVLIDGDMRLPTLHKKFKLPNEVGLSNLLRQEVTLDDVLQRPSAANISIITSGPVPANPAELLDSEAMIAALRELSTRFDVVLLDSPALLAVPDASILATHADVSLFVVRQAKSRSEAITAAREQLSTVGARVIGVVVNRSEHNSDYRYYRRRQT